MKSSSNEAIATHGFSLQRLPDPQLFANFHLLSEGSSIDDVQISSGLGHFLFKLNIFVR